MVCQRDKKPAKWVQVLEQAAKKLFSWGSPLTAELRFFLNLARDYAGCSAVPATGEAAGLRVPVGADRLLSRSGGSKAPGPAG